MDHKWFDYAVLVLIALNCITLAMERPNIPSHSVVSPLAQLPPVAHNAAVLYWPHYASCPSACLFVCRDVLALNIKTE